MAKGGRGKGAKRGLRGTRSGGTGQRRTNAQIKRNPDGSFAKKGTGQVRMGKPKTVKAKSKSVAIKGGASAVIAAKASARKPITAAKRKKLTKQGALEAKVGAIQQRKRAFNKKYKAKLAVEKVKRAQGKLRTASRKQGEMLKADGYKAQATKRLQYKEDKRGTIAKPKPKVVEKAAKAQTKVESKTGQKAKAPSSAKGAQYLANHSNSFVKDLVAKNDPAMRAIAEAVDFNKGKINTGKYDDGRDRNKNNLRLGEIQITRLNPPSKSNPYGSVSYIGPYGKSTMPLTVLRDSVKTLNPPAAAPSTKVQTPNANAKAIDFNDYAGRRGYVPGAAFDHGLLSPSGKRSKREDKAAKKANGERLEQSYKLRDKLRTEYDAKVNAGEIRPLTALERTKQTASGNIDNQSTKAALRLLSKRDANKKKREGYKPKATDKLKAKAQKQGTISKPKPKPKATAAKPSSTAAAPAAKAKTVSKMPKRVKPKKLTQSQKKIADSAMQKAQMEKGIAKKNFDDYDRRKPEIKRMNRKDKNEFLTNYDKSKLEYEKAEKNLEAVKKTQRSAAQKASKTQKSMMARPKGDLPRQIVIDERKGQDIKAEIKKVIRSGRAFQVPVDSQGRLDTVGRDTRVGKRKYGAYSDKLQLVFERNLEKARKAPPVMIRTKNGGRYEINPSTYALNYFVDKVLKQGKKKKRKPKAKQQSLF
jgi:hypothetical protein